VDEECAATYVGETCRATADRMRDHRAATKHPTGQYTSKVKQHMHDRDHYYTPRDIIILNKDSYWHTRGISESIQIRALGPTINGDQGRHKLPHYYYNLIRDKITAPSREKMKQNKERAHNTTPTTLPNARPHVVDLPFADPEAGRSKEAEA
jgi:hypothetical protein